MAETTTTTTGAEGTTTTVEKTYTQAELDAMLQAETDRRVTEALKKADKKKESAVKEAEKLAKMNADEQYQYQLEQREKAIQEKEKQLALMENKNEASKILAEKGISLSLVDFIVAEDADTMMDNIKIFETAFKQSVLDEVNKRLNTTTPKQNLNTKGMDKEAFKKLSIAQQSELYTNNPDLYKTMFN